MENTLISIPQQRPESVSDILNTLKRYDASVIKELQDYLQLQVTENFQDLSSNLALLKLYELANTELDSFNETEHHTIQILLKGLINFNYADFQLCLNLLPSYTIINEKSPFVNSLNEKIQKLIQIYQILSKAKFIEFWDIYNKDQYLKDEIITKHFNSSSNWKFEIQRSIASLISIAYNSINTVFLQKILDIESQDELLKFIESFKWTLKDDKVIIKNTDTKDEQTVNINTETIKIEQINRLIKKAFEN